jgi:hypothetical protein
MGRSRLSPQPRHDVPWLAVPAGIAGDQSRDRPGPERPTSPRGRRVERHRRRPCDRPNRPDDVPARRQCSASGARGDRRRRGGERRFVRRQDGADAVHRAGGAATGQPARADAIGIGHQRRQQHAVGIPDRRRRLCAVGERWVAREGHCLARPVPGRSVRTQWRPREGAVRSSPDRPRWHGHRRNSPATDSGSPGRGRPTRGRQCQRTGRQRGRRIRGCGGKRYAQPVASPLWPRQYPGRRQGRGEDVPQSRRADERRASGQGGAVRNGRYPDRADGE